MCRSLSANVTPGNSATSDVRFNFSDQVLKVPRSQWGFESFSLDIPLGFIKRRLTGHQFGMFAENFKKLSRAAPRERCRKQDIGVQKDFHLSLNPRSPSSFIR